MHFTPCSERELYWNIACAEANSPRYGGIYARVPPPLLDRIKRGAHDELSAGDLQAVTAIVKTYRAPLLEGLVELGTDWFQGALPATSLEAIRLLNYGPFVCLAPRRDLGTFVTALDAGHDPPGDENFGQNYRRFRAEYDSAKSVGRPVLVAATLEGPYTEIEGLTRMCSLISKLRAGEPVEPRLPVLIGICLQFEFWKWR
jgi:hypothetical protein